jgi:hypothetical protein
MADIAAFRIISFTIHNVGVLELMHCRAFQLLGYFLTLNIWKWKNLTLHNYALPDLNLCTYIIEGMHAVGFIEHARLQAINCIMHHTAVMITLAGRREKWCNLMSSSPDAIHAVYTSAYLWARYDHYRGRIQLFHSCTAEPPIILTNHCRRTP